MPDVFLTPKELAQRWHFHVNTLTAWRMKGVGPAYTKMGSASRGRVLYKLADVEAYEAERAAK